MTKLVREYLVRECDLDSFGHVNNVAIFQYLENARWDFIAHSGFNGVEEMKRTQKGPIVLDAQVSFRKELKVREPIRVETQWASFTRKVGVMKQEVFNLAGELACYGEYKMGLLDLQTRKLVTPDAHWLTVLGVSKL